MSKLHRINEASLSVCKLVTDGGRAVLSLKGNVVAEQSANLNGDLDITASGTPKAFAIVFQNSTGATKIEIKTGSPLAVIATVWSPKGGNGAYLIQHDGHTAIRITTSAGTEIYFVASDDVAEQAASTVISGEVAVYNKTGTKLDVQGDVGVSNKTGTKLDVQGDVGVSNTTGTKVEVTGDVGVSSTPSTTVQIATPSGAPINVQGDVGVFNKTATKLDVQGDVGVFNKTATKLDVQGDVGVENKTGTELTVNANDDLPVINGSVPFNSVVTATTDIPVSIQHQPIDVKTSGKLKVEIDGQPISVTVTNLSTPQAVVVVNPDPLSTTLRSEIVQGPIDWSVRMKFTNDEIPAT